MGAQAVDDMGSGAVHDTQKVRRRLGQPAAPPAPAWWRRWGADADAAAAALVRNMSREEKARLVQGVGWSTFNLLPNFYVGSIYAVPRLGIPSINMQDAAQGFRTLDPRVVGQVTPGSV
jgi:hypothetical protein